jgi:hypothetical protein
MPKQELAVVEGRWFEDSNVSVAATFNMLSDLLYGTPHGYFHHHFSDAASLEHVMRHLAARPEVLFLYLGAHGNDKGVYGALGEGDGKVSRTALRNALWRCWEQGVGSFDGLYIGSCGFTTEANAELLLCGEKAPPKLKWVAGYTQDIDWVDSSLLDALFFRRVLAAKGKTPVERVKAAAKDLAALAPGLCAELGFNVFIRKPGPAGGVKALI